MASVPRNSAFALTTSAFVIAELGVNHDGDVDLALRLVDAAAEAGADAVKLQVFDPQQLLSRHAALASYQEGVASSAHEMLARLTLDRSALQRVVQHARAAGLSVLATPFSESDCDVLRELELDAVKIASPDAVNPPLLDAAFALGLPVVVSTGACTLDECRPVAQRLLAHPAGGALLHCVSCYPTPLDHATLRGIRALERLLDSTGDSAVVVGYSDHTTAEDTGGLAVAAGARVLEKHLTLDRTAPGPDHGASLDPNAFVRYVELVRRAEVVLGKPGKAVASCEADVRHVARQSVAAARDLDAGHMLRRGDLTTMRPGTGIPAAQLHSLLGKTLREAVSRGELIAPGHVREDSSDGARAFDK